MAEHGEPAPPWAMYPQYQRGGMGWMMGAGKLWMDMWQRFMSRIDTEKERLAYLKRHSQAPHNAWLWVAEALKGGPIAQEGDDAEVWRKKVEEAELLGIDAAYKRYVEIHTEKGPPPPWLTSPTPEHGLKAGARVLGWWARWCKEHSDRAEASLVLYDDPTDPWKPIVKVLRVRQEATSRRSSFDLVCELAASGTLAPPWTYGAELPSHRWGFMDDATIPERWRWWVLAVFDDQPTWTAYLANYEDPPEEWQDAMKRHLGWLTKDA